MRRKHRRRAISHGRAGRLPAHGRIGRATPTDYLKRILNARVYDVAHETPLERAQSLSRRLGNTVLLKREDLQPVFSFKLGGAYNKMENLDPAQRAREVIAASAGNHAQGVALAAQRFGCRAVIVMPVTMPRVRIDAVIERGAEVVLHGDSYSDAFAHASAMQARDALTFVHPFDDPDVIAGQGTVGMESLRQCTGPIGATFVAIGGGGGRGQESQTPSQGPAGAASALGRGGGPHAAKAPFRTHLGRTRV
jgi:threonine dehydratase